jgi:hypothetical protein
MTMLLLPWRRAVWWWASISVLLAALAPAQAFPNDYDMTLNPMNLLVDPQNVYKITITLEERDVYVQPLLFMYSTTYCGVSTDSDAICQQDRIYARLSRMTEALGLPAGYFFMVNNYGYLSLANNEVSDPMSDPALLNFFSGLWRLRRFSCQGVLFCSTSFRGPAGSRSSYPLVFAQEMNEGFDLRSIHQLNYLSWCGALDGRGSDGKAKWLKVDSIYRQTCQDVSDCRKGEKMGPYLDPAIKYTPDSYLYDRDCLPCAFGTFSSMMNVQSCDNYSTCKANQYEVPNSATAATDRVCMPCQTCTDVQNFIETPCQTDKDTVCRERKRCPPGTYRTLPVERTLDALCEPCPLGMYQESSNHTATSCNQVTPTCQPGERQRLEPWASRNRACEACPEGKYQPSATTSSDCLPVLECGEGLTESAPPTATSNRKCRPLGPPTAECPSDIAIGAVAGRDEYPSGLESGDFSTNDPSATQQFSPPLTTLVSLGTVEVYRYRVERAPGGDGYSAACDTRVGVVSATTVCTMTADGGACLLPPAALNRPYPHEAVALMVSGAVGRVSFSALRSSLPQGMEAAVTTDLLIDEEGEDNAGQQTVRLRLSDSASTSGNYSFVVMADVSESRGASIERATTLVNGIPFSLSVLDCDDSSGSCVNGRCNDAEHPMDGIIHCDCEKEFIADAEGRCTRPAVTLTAFCPCDLQLAAIPGNTSAHAPAWLTPDDFVGTGGAALPVRRSDGRKFFAPFPAGVVTTLTLTVVDPQNDQRFSQCTTLVAVAVIEARLMSKQDEVLGATPIAKGDGMVVEFEKQGLLASVTFDFALDDEPRLKKLGMEATVTSQYTETELLSGPLTTRVNTTLELYGHVAVGKHAIRIWASAQVVGTSTDGTDTPANVSSTPTSRCALPTLGEYSAGAEALSRATDGQMTYSSYDALADTAGALARVRIDRAMHEQRSKYRGNGGDDTAIVWKVTNCIDEMTCKNGGACIGERFSGDQPTCDCSKSDLRRAKDGSCTRPPKPKKMNPVTTIVAGPVAVVAITAIYLIYTSMRRKKMRKVYHIFISYRVDTDLVLAKALCNALQRSLHRLPLPGGGHVAVKCFFDKQDLVAGKDWKKSFLDGLRRSCLFLPIVSEAGLTRIKNLQKGDAEDNVLHEYEKALELKDERRIAILPLLRGATLDTEYNFEEFGGHMFPQHASPTRAKGSISATITGILRNQGFKLSDYMDEATGEHSPRLVDMIIDTLRKIAWGTTQDDTKVADDRESSCEEDESEAKNLLPRVAMDVDCLKLCHYWDCQGLDNGNDESVENGEDLERTAVSPLRIAWDAEATLSPSEKPGPASGVPWAEERASAQALGSVHSLSGLEKDALTETAVDDASHVTRSETRAAVSSDVLHDMVTGKAVTHAKCPAGRRDWLLITAAGLACLIAVVAIALASAALAVSAPSCSGSSATAVSDPGGRRRDIGPPGPPGPTGPPGANCNASALQTSLRMHLDILASAATADALAQVYELGVGHVVYAQTALMWNRSSDNATLALATADGGDTLFLGSREPGPVTKYNISVATGLDTALAQSDDIPTARRFLLLNADETVLLVQVDLATRRYRPTDLTRLSDSAVGPMYGPMVVRPGDGTILKFHRDAGTLLELTADGSQMLRAVSQAGLLYSSALACSSDGALAALGIEPASGGIAGSVNIFNLTGPPNASPIVTQVTPGTVDALAFVFGDTRLAVVIAGGPVLLYALIPRSSALRLEARTSTEGYSGDVVALPDLSTGGPHFVAVGHGTDVHILSVSTLSVARTISRADGGRVLSLHLAGGTRLLVGAESEIASYNLPPSGLPPALL